MPKVSVITPCYNSEKFIASTIESVRRQSLQDWEHLVVDDGSSDRSEAIIQGYLKNDSRIKLISQNHAGVCRARNHGFEAASVTSAYLLFLDADDCLEPEMLEKLVCYLDAHQDVGLIRCEYQFIDEKGVKIEHSEGKYRFAPSGWWVRKLSPDEPETPFVSVFTLCGIIPSITLIRRSVYEQTPGFDETFGHHHEDADLFISIALRSLVHFFPQKLVRRRRHAGQNTMDTPEFRIKAGEQERKLYAKWFHAEGLSEVQRKMIRSAWRFKEGRLEPYLAFRRARNCLSQAQLLNASRNCAGGLKRYILSFIP